MLILRQSTAVDVLIGPFVDKSDGFTAEEAETPYVMLSKNGQALAGKESPTGTGTDEYPTHTNAGYYMCDLSAVDTDTVGTLVLVVEASANALPVRHEFQVMEEAVYDALFGGNASGFDANGRVDVGKWLGTAAATPTVAGVPEVDVTYVNGNAASPTSAIDANLIEINGATTPVDNLEDAYDGTGYNVGAGQIVTASVTAGVTLADGAHGGSSATLSLASATINNSSGIGLSITGSSIGVDINGGSGYALDISGLGGIKTVGTDDYGLWVQSTDSSGVFVFSTNDKGVEIQSNGGYGLDVTGTSRGLSVSASAGPGVFVSGTTIGMDINASAGVGIDIDATQTGVSITSTGSGYAGLSISQSGAVGGEGVVITTNGTDSKGLYIGNTGTGPAVHLIGSTFGIDIDSDDIGIDIGATGIGINVESSASDAIYAASLGGNGDGMQLVGNGTGKDLNANIEVTSLTSAAFDDIWETDTLTETYASDGSAPTPAQAFYMVMQALTEFVISGTGISVKKLDGSTEAARYGMDSATTPTSRTRTS